MSGVEPRLPRSPGAPCRTTHTACSCVLARLAALEAERDQLLAQLARADEHMRVRHKIDCGFLQEALPLPEDVR